MNPSAEQLQIASRLDAKVQGLVAAGTNDLDLFVAMADDLPDFQRLLDEGLGAMDALCLHFEGLGHYANILEEIADGIASGEIQVPT